MRIAGWRSRQMLQRYAASAADERARDATSGCRRGTDYDRQRTSAASGGSALMPRRWHFDEPVNPGFAELDLHCARCIADPNISRTRLGIVRRGPDDTQGFWAASAALALSVAPDGSRKIDAHCPRCGARPQMRGDRIEALLSELQAEKSFTRRVILH